MALFVVFRECRGIMAWYVEAPDEAAAIERVWPEDPSEAPALLDSGGMETPHVEACVDAGPPWARRVRRFPREGAHAVRADGRGGEET